MGSMDVLLIAMNDIIVSRMELAVRSVHCASGRDGSIEFYNPDQRRQTGSPGNASSRTNINSEIVLQGSNSAGEVMFRP